ncbi:MAG: hypothetical protein Q9209_001651 [Squamulea sp. 1 TL-2023]
MTSKTPVLRALQQVSFGASNFYANSPETQEALTKAIRARVEKDAELEKTAVNAELVSGLHPKPDDKRPHWTFEILDNLKKKILSIHLTPQEVEETLGYKPASIEDEEKRVVEKAGKGQGIWNLYGLGGAGNTAGGGITGAQGKEGQ